MKGGLLLRWTVITGLVLTSAAQIRSFESSSGSSLQLLYRLPMSEIQLPAEWFSMRDIQPFGEAYWDPDGRYVWPTEKVADDLLVASASDLVATFLPYAVSDGQVETSLPGESALLIRWEHGSGMLEVQNAAWYAANGPESPFTLMGTESIPDPDPVTGHRPSRADLPPQLKRWVPAVGASGHDPMRVSEPLGTGYLEIYGDGGMLFAAGGSLQDGPGDQQGWLNVAIDFYGDLYLWWDQE